MNGVYIRKSEIGNDAVEKFFYEDLISVDNLISAIDELLYKVHELEEEVDDLKSELPRFNPYKEYGISENDFH